MVSPRLRKSLRGAWLRFRLFFTGLAFVFVVTSTIGCSKRPPGSRFSLLWTQYSIFVIRWGSLSVGRSLRFVPTQSMVYLGVLLDAVSFRASPTQKRVEKLLSIFNVFLSCEEQPVSSWLELLGVLSSMFNGWSGV